MANFSLLWSTSALNAEVTFSRSLTEGFTFYVVTKNLFRREVFVIIDRQGILKAGGIGTIILIVLNILGLIPNLYVSCFAVLISLVTYVGIGILAAYWMTLPRTTGSGAGNGAAAAVVAALAAGAVNLVISSISGNSQLAQAFADLPPEQLTAMSEAGFDPTDPTMLTAGAFGIGIMCCGLWTIIAAGLGAAGGTFWGNSHPS